MNNALFITGLATFFHIWGGAMLGTAITKLTANQYDRQVLYSILGGALSAFTPLLITAPTWRILNQPIILGFEVLILMLAIGFPMFIPLRYRQALFGLRTYWVWLGLGLVACGVVLFFEYQEMAQCVGLATVLAGIWFVWRGVKMIRKS